MREKEHSRELEKIEELEKIMIIEEERLRRIRSKSTPCHIKNLNTPRTCYHNSNYQCSWNDEAKRCDLK